MNTIHLWKHASPEFRQLDPEVVAKELEKVKARFGVITPATIVESAKNPKSPIHSVFPWDDAQAAKIGREVIAGRLVRSLHVQIIKPEGAGETIPVRAFSSFRVEKKAEYQNTVSAMQDDEGRAVMLRTAWLELRAWRRKYAALSELAGVFDALDKALSKTG